MEDYWNLLDMKQKVFQMAQDSRTDTEARAVVISGIDSIIKKALTLEEIRALLPEELAVLIECPDWLMMCEEVVYGEV